MKTKLSLFLIALGIVINSSAQELFTISPSLHINFGNADKVRFSYGVEVAYWHLDDFYHSVDCGLEFEHKRLRVYSEVQTGVWFTGVSMGPVIEFSRLGDGAHIGFQGSIWTSNFVGIDYRRRWINGRKDHALGLMVNKYPIIMPEPKLDLDLDEPPADGDDDNYNSAGSDLDIWDLF